MLSRLVNSFLTEFPGATSPKYKYRQSETYLSTTLHFDWETQPLPVPPGLSISFELKRQDDYLTLYIPSGTKYIGDNKVKVEIKSAVLHVPYQVFTEVCYKCMLTPLFHEL
jgi:hypothetical protein